MPKEASLWQLLRDNLSKEVHYQRIETGGTAKGVPDVNLCYRSREVWIELKSITGNKLNLSEFQIVWMHNRDQSGGKCLILVKKGKQIRAFDVADYELEDFLDGKVKWNSEFYYSLTPPYDWEDFHSFLKRF